MGRVPDVRTPVPAHRPSRRHEIVAAAIRQFARKGFVDASIADIAAEADVAATAVYYHFSGKEELFSEAVAHVFRSITEVVATTRGDDGTVDASSLDRAIDAVWDWIDEHPDEATLLYLQLPGATRRITTLRQEFEEVHTERAFGYFAGHGRSRPSPARRSLETLTARTLVDLLISVHTMRLVDGPLSGEPGSELRDAVRRLATRLVSV